MFAVVCLLDQEANEPLDACLRQQQRALHPSDVRVMAKRTSESAVDHCVSKSTRNTSRQHSLRFLKSPQAEKRERAMRADIDIRHATVDDTKALHELGVRTFVEAFGHAWKPDAMHDFLSSSYSMEAIRTSLEDPNTMILMAFLRGEDAPAGFAVLLHDKPRADLNPEEIAVCSENHTELEKFYVDKPFHGKGVAQALMDQVLRETRERDGAKSHRRHRVVWLRVWESNPRAIQFYRNCGFQECGDVEIFDGFRDLVFEYPVNKLDGIAAMS